MTYRLHADHSDDSGTYGQKFQLVKELLEKGALTEVPQEFRSVDEQPVIRTTTTQTVVIPETNKFNMSREHADHVDESGEYTRVWEEKYGKLAGGPVDPSTGESTWKGFLQQIIAEEKRKLNL